MNKRRQESLPTPGRQSSKVSDDATFTASRAASTSPAGSSVSMAHPRERPSRLQSQDAASSNVLRGVAAVWPRSRGSLRAADAAPRDAWPLCHRTHRHVDLGICGLHAAWRRRIPSLRCPGNLGKVGKLNLGLVSVEARAEFVHGVAQSLEDVQAVGHARNIARLIEVERAHRESKMATLAVSSGAFSGVQTTASVRPPTRTSNSARCATSWDCSEDVAPQSLLRVPSTACLLQHSRVAGLPAGICAHRRCSGHSARGLWPRLSASALTPDTGPIRVSATEPATVRLGRCFASSGTGIATGGFFLSPASSWNISKTSSRSLGGRDCCTSSRRTASRSHSSDS